MCLECIMYDATCIKWTHGYVVSSRKEKNDAYQHYTIFPTYWLNVCCLLHMVPENLLAIVQHIDTKALISSKYLSIRDSHWFSKNFVVFNPEFRTIFIKKKEKIISYVISYLYYTLWRVEDIFLLSSFLI